MDNPRPLFIHTGPRRRWYAVAIALWALGFLISYTYVYSDQQRMNELAQAYQRPAFGAAIILVVKQSAEYSFWLEERADQRRSSESINTSKPLALLASFGLRTDKGALVPVKFPTAGNHFVRTKDRHLVHGWQVARVTLTPGTYKATTRAGNMWVAAAPTPRDISYTVPVAGVSTSAVALILTVLVASLRRRANRRILAGMPR